MEKLISHNDIDFFSSFSLPNLVYTKVLSENLMIKIPSGFKLMDAKVLTSKYSRNSIRPTEVYTNRDADVNITFNLMSQTLTEADVEKYGQSAFRQISALKEVRDVKGDVRIINGRQVVLVAFYSKATDGDIYNLMFITSVKGKLMLGNFNCLLGAMSQWQTSAYEIVNSLKIP